MGFRAFILIFFGTVVVAWIWNPIGPKRDKTEITVPDGHRAGASILQKNVGISKPAEKPSDRAENGEVGIAKTEMVGPPRRDPFPQLEGYRNLIKWKKWQDNSEIETQRKLRVFLDANPVFRERIVDYKYPHAIFMGEKFARTIRQELSKHADGKFVFQGQKIFQGINDPELDPNSPICVVKFEIFKEPSAKTSGAIVFAMYKLIHPVNGERAFKGVRVEDKSRYGRDIVPRYIECGFFDEPADSNRYLLLETLHLYSTVGFPEK